MKILLAGTTVAAIAWLAAAPAWADIYRSVDEDGTVLYTDKPRPGAERVDLDAPAPKTARTPATPPGAAEKPETGRVEPTAAPQSRVAQPAEPPVQPRVTTDAIDLDRALPRDVTEFPAPPVVADTPRLRIERGAARVKVPTPPPALQAQPLEPTPEAGAPPSRDAALPRSKPIGASGRPASERLAKQPARVRPVRVAAETPLPPAQAPVLGYKGLRIVKPGSDEAVSGTLSVEVAFEPAVQVASHKLRIFVDGAVARELKPRNRLELAGIERGSHSMQAALVDGEDNILILAAPITFHVTPPARSQPPRQPRRTPPVN